MLKRVLSITIAATIVASLFVGCGSKEVKKDGDQAASAPAAQKGKNVTIKMSDWLETEEATKGIFKTMIDSFQKNNPNIKVETTGIPFNNYKDQVLIALSSGDTPDVIQGNSQMMSAFDGAQGLAPLEGLIKKDVIDDIFPNNLAGTTFGGKIKALSWVPHPIALFYNKDLFQKAGLDPEKPPKTWDEMVDYAKKISALKKDKDGNQVYGLGIEDGKESHAGAAFIGIMYSFGGEFVSKDGKVTFDNPGTKEALKFIKDMVAGGIMPPSVVIKDIRGLFAAGRVGICFDGDMGRGVFRTSSGKGTEFDKIMGVATMPVGKTGKSETVYTEHQIAIGSSSKNKPEAAMLVEHLLGKDMALEYHKAYASMSARKSIAALPEMNEDNYMKVFNEQSKTARPLPVTSNMFDNACLEITKGMERITLTNEDIDKVVKDVQASIEKIYSGK